MTYQELVAGFEAKQLEIVKRESELRQAKRDVEAEVQAIIDVKEAPLKKLAEELNKLKEEYRAEVKAAFGITDGEPANVLEIVKTVRRVQGMQ
jgi:uncharacterized protein YPO0396